MRMLLEYEQALVIYNSLAAAFAWLLLVGYLVFLGTFTTLQNSNALKITAHDNQVDDAVYRTVQNLPLLGLITVSCVIGAVGSR
jgi:hypothetical protein